mgnify:CR=1 FL=1
MIFNVKFLSSAINAPLFHTGKHIVNASRVEEVALRNIVMLTFQNLAEAADGFGNRNILSFHSCKLPCNEEGLGKESLYLSRTGYHQLILLGKLIHTQDSNDILQLVITLQQLLHTSGHTVMLLPYNSGIQNSGGGLQRVNRRINTQLYDGTGKYRCRIQMGKGCGRSGVR